MSPPLFGRGFVRSAGAPKPDKDGKGQNSKILVTAGTIKRPLPCHAERIEKLRIFHDIKKKKQSKKRRKKD